jgi:NAD(P)-dependent dehydrogenase (short-subunit alcohol dehydrogenase family)
MATALVTGAGRGLGLEFARQYAVDGWQVIACARSPGSATALLDIADASCGRVQVHALDVGDPAAIERLAAQLRGCAIDVLINNAGTMGNASYARQAVAADRFGSCDFADWQQVLRINTVAPLKMAEAFVAHVAQSEQRKIVSLTSILSSIGSNTLGGLYSYRASKAALNAIMRSLSIDLGRRYNIVAIPIHPGWARTDMGGAQANVDPATSVQGMRAVIAGLTQERSGRFWMYDGTELPW